MRQGTSDELRKQIIEAHGAGPVPPRVAASRGRTCNAISENAGMVRDSVFTLLGDITGDEFDQAILFLRAGYDSDDRPDHLPQE
eukprot:6455311-Pyramimonas_sp.AAC.1